VSPPTYVRPADDDPLSGGAAAIGRSARFRQGRDRVIATAERGRQRVVTNPGWIRIALDVQSENFFVRLVVDSITRVPVQLVFAAGSRSQPAWRSAIAARLAASICLT
jgi:hypothetical protein